MSAAVEQELIRKIKSLTAPQMVEVSDFVAFLSAQAIKREALDRLLAIAPACEAAGVEPLTEEEIAAEVRAVREQQRMKQVPDGQRGTIPEQGADRS